MYLVREFANLPSQLTAGQTYILSKEKIGLVDVALNGNALTEINGKWVFTPGLYSPKTSWFTTVLNTKNSMIKWPTLELLVVPTQVSHEAKNDPSRLNISDKVWRTITTDTDEQIAEDKRRMWEAYKLPSGPLLSNCWQKPVESVMVSKFGSPRQLPSGKTYFHSGVDLRARTGTPIFAAADGEVMVSEHMVLPGNTILLSHGGGFYSRYMHLSKLEVPTGSHVKKGQRIGLAGATGRVEAAHLHWEVLWKGNHADPLQFLQAWEQICDPT